MAVQVSKSGGIYIEISGDYSKLQADLREAGVIGKAMGKEISDALSGALSPRDASRYANNLTKYLSTARRSAQATTADLSGIDKQFREMGKAIKVAEGDMDNFVKLQRQMYQAQAQKGFMDNLRGIQRLTGATDAEMNKLAKSLGGVGNEFSKAAQQGNALDGVFTRLIGLAGAYASIQSVGSFIGMGIQSNATMQDASTGIAAMLASTQRIVSAQGQLLEDREKFNAALSLSEEIAKRIDAATATASANYNEFLGAFQASLGPATSLGMTWEQNVKYISDISNAMKVLRVDMSRLDQEVLALLTGKNLSESQVLRGLPKVNAADIQSWIKAGTLFENLSAQLKQFEYAGEHAAETYSAVTRDLSGTIESLAEAVTKELFGNLTKSAQTMSRAFYTLEKDGESSVYVLRQEMEALVQVGQYIGAWFGERLLSSTQSLASGLESLSGFIARNKEEMNFALTVAKNLAAGYASVVIVNKTIIPAVSAATEAVKMLRMEMLTAQSRMQGFASIGKSVFSALGGWTTISAAAAGAVIYLYTQETHAQKVAKDYAKEIEELGKAYEEASHKAAGLASTEKEVIINQQQKKLDSALEDFRKTQKEFKRLAMPGNLGFWSVDHSEIDNAIKAANEGTTTFKELWESLARIQNGMREAGQGSKEFHEMLSGLIDKAQGAAAIELRVNNITDSINKLRTGLDSMAESARISGQELTSALDHNKVAKGIRDLEDKIAQARRTAVGQASATALISIGVDSSDIDKFGNVSAEAFAKYDAATQASITKTQALARELHSLNTAARTTRAATSTALSENRAVKFAEDAYIKARDAAEQLRLKNIELAESLRGDTFAASIAKIGRQYQAQVDSIEKDTRDLLAKQEEWRSKGLLTSEVQAFIEQYQEQNRIRLEALEIERQYNEEVARRSKLESALGFRINEAEILKEKMDALTESYEEGYLSLEQYESRLVSVGLELAKLHQIQGESSFAEDVSLALSQITEGYEGVTAGLTESFGNFFQSFTQGFADSIGRAVVESENLGEALHNVAKSAISSLISALVQLGIQWAMMQMGMTTASVAAQQTVAATSTATNAEVLASAAPAAAAQSVASWGTAAVVGAAALAAAMGLMIGVMMKGFKTGGYTGNIGENEVAGVVHGGEYVFNADSVRRIGLSQLEAMQRGSVGSSTSSGSGDLFSQPGTTSVNVSIENYGTGKDFEVQQLSESEIRVIARDEARSVTREYAPKVIASDISNPNSAVSKSLGKNTKAERRR